MEQQGTIDKVVELVQTETKAKIFRPDYPVSEDLRQVMVSEVFGDFMIYALNLYYDDENHSLLKEFVDEHGLSNEKRDGLLHNLFWWNLFYQSSRQSSWSCMEDYISENFQTLRNKPFISSWLRECEKAVPKFYFIGHKYNDRVFVAIDILTEKPLDVVVYDPAAISPKKGEIAMGTLIPLGGGLHFPIVDFYHFDYGAREAMASCLHHHFDKYLKTSTMHVAFFHVLSVMLQIERIIVTENKEKLSSK
ncbi:hypothetical protein [Neobacillus soli]|uniref:hypothetical protein n=1 Tax=Neobacillus soli TaxID=220688 RepID=UPI000825E22A|nr:hypothetical protein [Neobacillus soli]